MKTSLAFPATALDAINFSDRKRRNGWRVIGAASVASEGLDIYYDAWVNLPYIHDADFKEAIINLIAREKISKIYTSHEVVKKYFCSLIQSYFPDVDLEITESFSTTESFLELCAQSYSFYEDLVLEFGVINPVAKIEHVAILNRAFQMRGESGLKKLSCLMAILGIAPRGDVVEIGVLSGRSAFILGWLARRYNIGSVLCIDPWSSEEAIQQDSPETLQNASRKINFNDFFFEFRLNLLPSFHSDLNYVREPAIMARSHFMPNFQVCSTEFGATNYVGQISLLHIDGNHDYEKVSNDLEMWSDLVLPSGWIVIDDYEWEFGNGPHRAADELVAKNPKDFQRSFVNDGTLFLQRA